MLGKIMVTGEVVSDRDANANIVAFGDQHVTLSAATLSACQPTAEQAQAEVTLAIDRAEAAKKARDPKEVKMIAQQLTEAVKAGDLTADQADKAWAGHGLTEADKPQTP